MTPPAPTGGLAPEPVAVDLTTRVGPLPLANPVMAASGCFGSGREMDRFFDVARLGAVVCPTLTLEPRDGAPTPRMAETASGMLHAVGLQNAGVDAWMAEDLPWLAGRGAFVVASVAGATVAEYRRLGERLRGADGVMAVEANLAWPNAEDGDRLFACRAQAAHEAVDALRRASGLPVLAKLTADVTDVVEIAEAARSGGAAGVSAITTPAGMAIDVGTRRPKLAAVTGGLSGPAIKPLAVRCVHEIHQALPDLPIVGVGGVRDETDVVEFLLAGASAVAVGTATFTNPLATTELLDRLPGWLAERGVDRVADLVGAVQP